MSIEKILYVGEATATGGREGQAASTDGALDVKLSTPRELGGGGGSGTNPEQLFAAGYAACFENAVRFIAGQQKLPIASKDAYRAGAPDSRSRAQSFYIGAVADNETGPKEAYTGNDLSAHAQIEFEAHRAWKRCIGCGTKGNKRMRYEI